MSIKNQALRHLLQVRVTPELDLIQAVNPNLLIQAGQNCPKY
jgi:hypothetical protein